MFFLNSYSEQLEYLRNNPIVQPIKIKENWANLLSINTNKTLNNDFVSPLTSLIKWGQGDNIFNYGFPNLYINGDINNKVQAITGCCYSNGSDNEKVGTSENWILDITHTTINPMEKLLEN